MHKNVLGVPTGWHAHGGWELRFRDSFRERAFADMNALSSEQVAWVAAWYDGEGSANSSAACLRLHITQKDDWVVNRLRDVIGVGHVYPRNDGCSTYSVSGTQAETLASTILSWLSPRRQEQIRYHITRVYSPEIRKTHNMRMRAIYHRDVEKSRAQRRLVNGQYRRRHPGRAAESTRRWRAKLRA